MKYLKKIKLFAALSFSLLICACSNPQYDLEVKKSIEYVSEEIDVCSLISKVDGKQVEDHHRESNKIQLNDMEVTCPNKNVRKLGKQETVIQVNGIDHTLFFEVVDTSSPKITAENEYTVEVENTYFDFKKMISISDDYDQNPIISFTGDFDITKAGVYKIKVSAKDVNKNKSNKEISIKVIEKEVVIKEVEVVKPVEVIVESGNNTVNTNENNSNSQSANIAPGVSSLPAKYFRKEDGYTTSSGFNACKEYRGSNSGSCTPYTDGEGLYGGHIYQP